MPTPERNGLALTQRSPLARLLLLGVKRTLACCSKRTLHAHAAVVRRALQAAAAQAERAQTGQRQRANVTRKPPDHRPVGGADAGR